MARKKIVRGKIKMNKKNWSGGIILLAVVVFILLYLFISSQKVTSLVGSKLSQEKLISPVSLGKVPLTPPPATPTPTLTPTPTPIPLIGYCLNVPVLMYHHIQPEAEAQAKGQKSLTVDSGEFDNQMGYLTSHGYSAITSLQLVEALINHSGLPSKSIVITMDDGYSDIYQYAYPILQKYHIIANLMIPTGLIGGVDYLSWGQLEEMAHSGLAYVGDHTWSHYAITSGSDDKIKFEIDTAKQQLQDHTGQNVNIFTYPYGAINNRAIAALRQSGIVGAFSEIPGHWQCDSFLMTLHRSRIGNANLSYYGL